MSHKPRPEAADDDEIVRQAREAIRELSERGRIDESAASFVLLAIDMSLRLGGTATPTQVDRRDGF